MPCANRSGTVAATLAGRRDDLDAVVLLATPVPPIHSVLVAQAATLADLVDAAGQSELPAAVQQVAELRTLADQVTDIANGQVDGPSVGGVPRTFWTSWIDASRAAPEWLESSSAPALVLGGSNDWNVPPAQVEAWAPALSGPDELAVDPDSEPEDDEDADEGDSDDD